MNPDSLIELWNVAENRPDPAASLRLTEGFVRRLRRRRRLQAAWLTWCVLALGAASSLAVVHVARNGFSGFVEQWTLFPLLVLPWILTIRFCRAFLREGSVPSAPLPLPLALKAAQVAQAAECRRLVSIGWLFVPMVPLMGLAVWQLHATGKASINEAWSMAAVFAAGLMLGAVGMRLRYRLHLLPEQRNIAALLRELEPTAAV